MIKFTVIPKKAIWQNWCFGQFYHSKICNLVFSVSLVRGKSERIERIHFAESSGLDLSYEKYVFVFHIETYVGLFFLFEV